MKKIFEEFLFMGFIAIGSIGTVFASHESDAFQSLGSAIVCVSGDTASSIRSLPENLHEKLIELKKAVGDFKVSMPSTSLTGPRYQQLLCVTVSK